MGLVTIGGTVAIATKDWLCTPEASLLASVGVLMEYPHLISSHLVTLNIISI